MVDTSNVQMRRAMAILDAEIDRREPMRFLRHRDVMAWKRRQQHVEWVATMVRQNVPLPALPMPLPAAREFRGGPLVV